MDTKKELVIKVLEKLQWHRDMADWILALIKIVDLDDETIEWIIEIIWDAVKSTSKNKEKEKLEKIMEKLEKIKQMEEPEKMADDELDNLLMNT